MPGDPRAFVLVVGPRAANAHPLWNALWSIARASAAGPHLCPACTGGETATQPFWVQETVIFARRVQCAEQLYQTKRSASDWYFWYAPAIRKRGRQKCIPVSTQSSFLCFPAAWVRSSPRRWWYRHRSLQNAQDCGRTRRLHGRLHWSNPTPVMRSGQRAMRRPSKKCGPTQMMLRSLAA